MRKTVREARCDAIPDIENWERRVSREWWTEADAAWASRHREVVAGYM